MVDHRHVRLTAGDLGAAVEDEGGREVDRGQGRLGWGERQFSKMDGIVNKEQPRLREPASSSLEI